MPTSRLQLSIILQVKAANHSGANLEDLHVPKLWYYNLMLFLVNPDESNKYIASKLSEEMDGSPTSDTCEVNFVFRFIKFVFISHNDLDQYKINGRAPKRCTSIKIQFKKKTTFNVPIDIIPKQLF